MHIRAVFLWTLFSFSFLFFPGNGLIDETEFLQWVGRIQALRDDTQSQSSGSSQDENLDDVTQDLIAAFRYYILIHILFWFDLFDLLFYL